MRPQERTRPSGRVFLVSLSVLGAFAIGASLGSLWRESTNTCALAGVLLEDIRTLLTDGHEVVSDPYLAHAFGPEDSLLSRLDLERELAHRIQGRFGRFHLPLAFLMDLTRLSELKEAPLETSLQALESWRRSMHPVPDAESLLASLSPDARDTRDQRPPGAPGIAFGAGMPEPWYSDPMLARAKLKELAESDHRRIAEARGRIPSLRAELDTDSSVYCRSMATLHRMQLVQDAEKQACANGEKRARCGRAALLRFEAEVGELKRVRSLNEKKLREKWGEKLYAGIRCE